MWNMFLKYKYNKIKMIAWTSMVLWNKSLHSLAIFWIITVKHANSLTPISLLALLNT